MIPNPMAVVILHTRWVFYNAEAGYPQPKPRGYFELIEAIAKLPTTGAPTS